MNIAGLSPTSMPLLLVLRVSKHIAQKFLSAILVLVGSSSFSCCSPSLLSAGAFTAEHEMVLGGGGEGEAAWEEKKEAQERPIRLAAALRHLASVPSPPQSSPPISSSSQSVAAAAAAPSVGFVDRPPLFHFRQLDSQRWTLLLANSKTIIWPKILGQCAREETISTSSIRRQVRIQSGKTIPKILIGWHLIQQE